MPEIILENIQIEKKDSYPLSDGFIDMLNRLLMCMSKRWQGTCAAHTKSGDGNPGTFWLNKCKECGIHITDAELVSTLIDEAVALSGFKVTPCPT